MVGCGGVRVYVSLLTKANRIFTHWILGAEGIAPNGYKFQFEFNSDV
jgi:hypothetical protein